MLRSLSAIALYVVLTAVGLAAGWQFGHHAAEHDHAHEDEHDDHADEHDDEHAHDDHEDEEHGLTEQTLKTLGVRTQLLALTDHVRSVKVRGVLVDRPENHRAVVAPVGGIVRAVHVESGAVVAAGAPLVSFTRDPIPLPALDTAMGIVQPVRERVHEAVAALRSAGTDLEIAEQEIARLAGLAAQQDGDLPGLFGNRLVTLRAERARAKQRVTNSESELHHHGLTDAEIATAAAGGHAPEILTLWRRVLAKGGLWGEHEDAVLSRLPTAVRTKPWPLVVLADLSLRGLVGTELLGLLDTEPAAVAHFREVAALLLDGRPIENVRVIASLGALEPDIVLRAPREGAAHWDVERLLAKVGQKLTAGASVADLHDPRRLWLRVEPIGSEVAHVRRAVREHLDCRAKPVLADAAPDLPKVHLRRLGRHEAHGAVAYAEVTNSVLLQEAQRRSWSLHAGTTFVVRVPLATLAQRYVLPVEAVVRSGPDRIVYVVEDHDEHEEDHEDDPDHDHDDEHEHEHHVHFHPVPVHVELDTDEVVVLAADAGLKAGQVVVVEGAFALHLALQQGRGNDDEHGHGHSHH